MPNKETIIESLLIVIIFWFIMLAFIAIIEKRSRAVIQPHVEQHDVHKPD
jgi:preprotein translocase subunit SecE